jgi:gluconate 2-dehydrogenase gamma chain
MVDIRRRGFLGGTAALAMSPLSLPAQVPDATARWFFLTADEAIFLWAAMSRLIPGDAISPSAAELGGVVFLDRQLASGWGVAADWYMEGPFEAGTPQQGYQLPFTPRDFYRRGIAALQARLDREEGAPFQDLPSERQDAVLQSLERAARGSGGRETGGSLGADTTGGGGGTGGNGREGDDMQHATLASAPRGEEGPEIDLDGVPGAVFFDRLLTDTKESFFADPAYGGNEDGAAWAMLGFPGVWAVYNSTVDNWSMPYDRPPAGVATEMRPYGVEGSPRFPTYDGPLDPWGRPVEVRGPFERRAPGDGGG